MGAEDIGKVGSENQRQDNAENHINDDNGKPIDEGVELGLASRFHEVGNCHGYHGENAGHEQTD